MSLLNSQIKKKEEHKRQDRDDPRLGGTREGDALIHLKSLRESLQLSELDLELALQQAENNPNVALVDKLWIVTGFSWDGTEFKAETSEKETADECKDDFGWEVKEEKGPFYKYSRSFGKPAGRGDLYKWVNQPEKIKPVEVKSGKSKRRKDEPEEIKRCLRTGIYTSGGTDLNNEAGVEMWKEFTIMKILWFNKNLRASFKDTNKTGKLDMTLLIDEERAKNLLSFLGFGDWGLPHEIRDWLERSAKPRAAESA